MIKPIPWEAIEALLHGVQKPGRYVGGEYNAVQKPWSEADIHVCLAFPDTYELGMSNFAMTILYDILNQQPGVLAERTYLPAPDMIAEMRAADLPLYTLERYYPVAAFDLLAISTAYEQLYTNILELLDLAHLPIHSAARDAGYPLVIGGGHGTFNAEPIADFLDAFVIGEGEDVVVDVVEALRATCDQSRDAQLRALLDIAGLYVPRFYTGAVSEVIAASEPSTGSRVIPTLPEAPPHIAKRIVATLPPTPVKQLVPNIDVVHNRAVIEIQRGCTRGCRFCQAGSITRPVRERPVEEIEASAAVILKATGYEEIAPLSLSSADHSEIQTLLERFQARFAEHHVTVSLPSLRIDSFSIDLADSLSHGRRSGFTVAPEAATDKLRHRINKVIPTDQLYDVAEEIFSRGWRTIKLYFMIGLPGETDEDIVAIADIAHEVRRIGRRERGRKSEVHVSASTFVPKPHTVFQWVPLARPEVIERRQAYLKEHIRGRGLRFMWNDYAETRLEALLGRGDRRLNAVVERAWQLGARFDAWRDWRNFDAWDQAIAETGLDVDAYLYRNRTEDEVFPWDHLHSGVEKAFLWRDYRRSQRGERLSDCRETCHACGILANYGEQWTGSWQCPRSASASEAVPVSQGEREAVSAPEADRNPTGAADGLIENAAEAAEPAPPAVRHRITFAKRGPLAYVSVLELGSIWERSLRRASVPLQYSQGFNPRPKLQLASALPVGCGGEAEWLDLWLEAPCSSAKIARALHGMTPQGLEISQVEAVDEDAPPLAECIIAAEYRVWVRETSSVVVAEAIAMLLDQESVPRPRRGRKHRGKTYDLRPLVEALALEKAPEPWVGIRMRLAARHGATGRADEVLKALGLGDKPQRCTRLRMIVDTDHPCGYGSSA